MKFLVYITPKFTVKLGVMYTRGLQVPKKASFLFGPRGTGKTTWLRLAFPDAYRIDLLPQRQSMAFLKNPSLLVQLIRALPKKRWVVIDEIQKVPLLLDEVHALIENEGYKNFILTGSSARKLRHGAANLLAGRAFTKHLFPLTSKEVNFSISPRQILTYGLMPMSVTGEDDQYRAEYLTNYVDTYLREEIKEEGLVRQLDSFARFLDVAALLGGQVVNVSGVSRDAGVPRDSVRGYFDILTDTLLGRWLPAYRPRAKVKEVAHPKFYWFDCGIARALSGGFRQPLFKDWDGFAMEQWIFHELSAYMHYFGVKGDLGHWRTPSQIEVDFVWWYGRTRVAIEVKASKTFIPKFAQGIQSLSQEGLLQSGWIVYLGDHELRVDKNIRVMPVISFLKKLYQGEVLSLQPNFL